jgi:hypothetical protein
MGRRKWSKARARKQRGHEIAFDNWGSHQDGVRAQEHARWKEQVTRELSARSRGQARKAQAPR